MKRIAIIGSGPTGLYILQALLAQGIGLAITVYEQSERPGTGMPYNDDDNSVMMLANIASIEIPPLASSYLDWLREQDAGWLSRYGVDRSTLHERQFLPRIVLGEYFCAQFARIVDAARREGHAIDVQASSRVVDLEAGGDGVRLWVEGAADPVLFDLVVIATGHVWPDEDEATAHYFPSPWSGLIGMEVPACRVGIMGTSLSAIDAAMAVVAQHGRFSESDDGRMRFDLRPGSDGLALTLMSRTGVLPEADFYCEIPYAPLAIATDSAIETELAAGADGLLDRVFALVAAEIAEADPEWSARVSLPSLDADSFSGAYFADRRRFDAFRWAAYNLAEVERNKRERHTVPWRYAILRLHEQVQKIVPLLDERDRERFDAGLCRVFMDNYAAIPSESIRRLLALRQAGLIDVLELGHDYAMDVEERRTRVEVEGVQHCFDVFIDARGQKPLASRDLPFPRLRTQLLATGEELPDIGEDYTLQAPPEVRGRIAMGAVPYLMHDQPFVQGITASAQVGAAIAAAVTRQARRTRRRLSWWDA